MNGPPKKGWLGAAFLMPLISLLCFLLSGCGSGIISEQWLKDRLARNLADFDQLVILVRSQPEEVITADSKSPKSPANLATWTKIHDLLIKLNVKSVSQSKHVVSVFVLIGDADLLRGRYYYFEYWKSPPYAGTIVPSLEKAWPYKTTPDGYYMRLQGNWWVSMYEDA